LIPINESTYQLGGVKFTVSGLAFSSLTNVIIFGFRNLIALLLYPNRFVVLNSSIQSVKLNKLTSKILKLADKVRHQYIGMTYFSGFYFSASTPQYGSMNHDIKGMCIEIVDHIGVIQ
jgi:hypothetical protein